MRTGQFIIGMVNGIIDSFQSLGVETLLPSESMRFLYDLGKYNHQGTFIHTWNFDTISKSILFEKSDGEGRKGTVNHTIIIKLDSLGDILDHTDFLKRLDTCFHTQYEGLSNPLPEVRFPNG